jgi:hypothetical protein
MNGLTIPKVKNDTLINTDGEPIGSARYQTDGEPIGSARSVRQDIVKSHIIQQIENLKTDIQNLLDKKKSISNDEMGDWSINKNEKMSQLKILTEKLKEINKKERSELRMNNERNKLSKTIDNLEYGAAKKKNNYIAMDKAKREKELRNEAREQYIKFQNTEKIYLEYDCDKLPGNLFLHRDILKSYGLCPFIDIQFDEENERINKNLTEDTYNKRLRWLQSQSDSGKLYFNLYDDLIKKTKCKEMTDNKIVLEKLIYDFIKENITESQMNIYDDCIKFIEEYVNCSIKTKRIKERYKLFINDLSVLYSETLIEFHTYFSIKYNMHIVVNILKSNVKQKDNFFNGQIKEQSDDLINKYKIKLKEIEKDELFIKNTLRNVNTDLYSFLTDKHTFVNKLSNLNVIKTNSAVQVGKYFKRWSVLTKQEQIERFESFSHIYVDKYLVNTLIIEKEDRDKMVEILFDLLKTNFENKRMVYRDYVWNTTRGFIESVKILKYNKDTGFILEFTKQTPSKDGQLRKEQEQGPEASKKNVPIKKVSSRTIITKDSEKIINEELLYFILTRLQSGVDKIDQEDKDAFCEKIKIKLKVKKLMLNDKAKIYKKYDEIFEVVKNNKG